MGAPTIVCWGELLWDLFPDGARLGGAAANLAHHARALGARAVLVSAVGDDELGDRALSVLSEHGVDVRFVQRHTGTATGTVHVTFVDGEPCFRIGASAAWDRIRPDTRIVEVTSECDAFCFGTLAQRTPLGSEALFSTLSTVRGGAHRIVDVNLRPPHVSRMTLERSLAAATVVKMNEAEADRLREALGVNDLAQKLIADYEVELVLITRGARGAQLFHGGGSLEHAGYPPRDMQPPDGSEATAALGSSNADPVGAGDAFTAALAVELCRGTDLGTLLARANRYAAFVASRPGGMPSVPADVLETVANTSA